MRRLAWPGWAMHGHGHARNAHYGRCTHTARHCTLCIMQHTTAYAHSSHAAAAHQCGGMRQHRAPCCTSYLLACATTVSIKHLHQPTHQLTSPPPCPPRRYVLTGMLGLCVSYHRQLTHRSFRCPKPLEYGLAYLGALAFEGDPIEWSKNHR